MSNLKPCPFCGVMPLFPLARDTLGTCYEAGCENCGMVHLSVQIIDCFDYETPPTRSQAHDSWDDDKLQYGIEFIEVAREELISQWNNRPTENKIKAEAVREATNYILGDAGLTDYYNQFIERANKLEGSGNA